MENKKNNFRISDLVIILITVLAVLFTVLAGAVGAGSRHIVFVIRFEDAGAEHAKTGDTVIIPCGGAAGTVIETGDGIVKVSAEAKTLAGVYYCGSTAIKVNTEYGFVVNSYHMKGTVVDLTAE